MDYKRRYEEALERAKQHYDSHKDNPSKAQEFIDIFPELSGHDNSDATKAHEFSVGDWVVWNGRTLQVLDNGTGGYHCDCANIPFERECEIRLWTLADAESGDVLSHDDGFVMLVDRSEGSLMRHCAILSDGFFQTFRVDTIDDGLHPATSEERKLLFEKIDEAGLMYDKKKNTLKHKNPSRDNDNSGL